MARWYFKPAKHVKERFRQNTVQYFGDSKVARWITLVGVELFESFLAGDVSQDRLHNTWIEYIEGSLKHELASDLAPHEVCNRRSALVHVSLMKTFVLHTSKIYQLLRATTPAFLQVTYSNPASWSSDGNPMRIPLLNLMTSDSHELAMFTLVDCTYAMATGLPQQIDYDTNFYSRPNISSSHQWEHYAPVEFQLVLADINACRDKSPFARDWKDIERWLLIWQSQPRESAFTESWMTIAWYAVQESMRLALLVYLYLAACNASSDDSKIQSYIGQILQVVGTIKKCGRSVINVSLFTQYLMVGICARSEAHRRIARDGLISANETRPWLIRAPDFVPVLDHLWHGAAARGHPVKWDDYIQSREMMLPIAG